MARARAHEREKETEHGIHGYARNARYILIGPRGYTSNYVYSITVH